MKNKDSSTRPEAESRSDGPIKIMLAEDHGIVREGLKKILEEEPGFKVIGDAEDGEEAVSLTRESNPDVAILDIMMPVLNGIEAARKIREQNNEIRLIFLTQFDNEDYLFRGFQAGVTGYVLKTAAGAELIWAIKTVRKGMVYLSPAMTRAVINSRMGGDGLAPGALRSLTAREQEVFKLLADGAGCKEIASKLYISPKTAHAHKQRVLKKLGLDSLAELVKYAISRRLIPEQK